MSTNQVLRTVFSVMVGTVFITVAVKALEFTLVTAISHEVLTEPGAYYAVRNGALFLFVKVLYSAAGALGGGYLAARLAGRAEVLHGGAVALIQAGTLAWAASQPDLAEWTPRWLWLVLIVVMPLDALVGAGLAARRISRRAAAGASAEPSLP